MNVKEAIMKRRTIRKFTQEPVRYENLIDLVDCARLAAFGGNMQPLKFMIVNDKSVCNELFPLTKWAAYLSDGAPKENERPSAYIIVLGDKKIKANGAFEVEAGAAVTNMMLEAVELGLGTCWMGAIQRESIKKLLKLEAELEVVYVLAVGYPDQESVISDFNGDVKYFEDEDGVIHVPKRSLDQVLVK